MKAVVFDFDGTLTYKSENVWKAIWKGVDLPIDKTSYFSELYCRFLNREITHQEWCDLTCDALKGKLMNRALLRDISLRQSLVKGVPETIESLKNHGYDLFICSGCIGEVIKRVLGEKSNRFKSIQANEMSFDDMGYLLEVKGTKYDFEGKALFIEDFKAKTGCKATDIIFVGNSNNDEWAHQSGCKTVCINPENTCSNNKLVWHSSIRSDDLRDILPLVLGENKEIILEG